MSLTLERPDAAPDEPAGTRLRIIDSDIHPSLAHPAALHPFLAANWREHLIQYGIRPHGIYAGRQLAGGADTVAAVLDDVDSARVSTKVRALLRIADHVRVGGRSVTTEDVEAARSEGATDLEIHDTVLIAAAFCMFNRYVDGLATWTPTDPAVYEANADRLLDQGYVAIPDR